MQKTEEMDQLDHPAHQVYYNTSNLLIIVNDTYAIFRFLIYKVNQELPDKMGRMELTGKMVKTELRVHQVYKMCFVCFYFKILFNFFLFWGKLLASVKS